MEFRKQATAQFSHFIFYLNNKCEHTANHQCELVKQKVASYLMEENITFVIGEHLFACLKQCGFDDDGIECVARSAKVSQHHNRLLKCNILPDPHDTLTAENHIHILIFVPKTLSSSSSSHNYSMVKTEETEIKTPLGSNVNDASEPVNDDHPFNSTIFTTTATTANAQQDEPQLKVSAATAATASVASAYTNWNLENAISKLQAYIRSDIIGVCSDAGLSGFRVFCRNVWCPYSIWFELVKNKRCNSIRYGALFCRDFEDFYHSQTVNYAKKELYPKRPPKLRAKIVWEIHWCCCYCNKKESIPNLSMK